MPTPRKKVTDFIYWLLWFKMPAREVEELVRQADGRYSSIEKPTYREAERLAEILFDD